MATPIALCLVLGVTSLAYAGATMATAMCIVPIAIEELTATSLSSVEPASSGIFHSDANWKINKRKCSHCDKKKN